MIEQHIHQLLRGFGVILPALALTCASAMAQQTADAEIREELVVDQPGNHLPAGAKLYLVKRGEAVFLEPGELADHWKVPAGGIRLRPSVRTDEKASVPGQQRIFIGWEFDVRIDPHREGGGPPDDDRRPPAPACDHTNFFLERRGDEVIITGADHSPPCTDGRHAGRAHLH